MARFAGGGARADVDPHGRWEPGKSRGLPPRRREPDSPRASGGSCQAPGGETGYFPLGLPLVGMWEETTYEISEETYYTRYNKRLRYCDTYVSQMLDSTCRR
jgi:hypothetical protein